MSQLPLLSQSPPSLLDHGGTSPTPTRTTSDPVQTQTWGPDTFPVSISTPIPITLTPQSSTGSTTPETSIPPPPPAPQPHPQDIDTLMKSNIRINTAAPSTPSSSSTLTSATAKKKIPVTAAGSHASQSIEELVEDEWEVRKVWTTWIRVRNWISVCKEDLSGADVDGVFGEILRLESKGVEKDG